MKWEEVLTDEQLIILKGFSNPTVREVVELSMEMNIDIEILAKYFIDQCISL